MSSTFIMHVQNHNFVACIIIFLVLSNPRMKLVLFWLHGSSNLGFLQMDDLTWFMFPICVDDHHYLVYQLSVDTMAPLCIFDTVGSELLEIEPGRAVN